MRVNLHVKNLKKAQAGNEWSNILRESSQTRKKPALPVALSEEARSSLLQNAFLVFISSDLVTVAKYRSGIFFSQSVSFSDIEIAGHL